MRYSFGLCTRLQRVLEWRCGLPQRLSTLAGRWCGPTLVGTCIPITMPRMPPPGFRKEVNHPNLNTSKNRDGISPLATRLANCVNSSKLHPDPNFAKGVRLSCQTVQARHLVWPCALLCEPLLIQLKEAVRLSNTLKDFPFCFGVSLSCSIVFHSRKYSFPEFRAARREG